MAREWRYCSSIVDLGYLSYFIVLSLGYEWPTGPIGALRRGLDLVVGDGRLT